MRLSISLFFLLFACYSLAAELPVRVQNAPDSGTLVLQVYDSANTFGDFRNPAVERRVEISSSSEYVIDNVPTGKIALLVYLDENNNGVIDKNFIGIPREPLGISNNYRPKGPPSFERASFENGDTIGQAIDIELFKVLGSRGQLGAGVGVIGQSSPYIGSDETVLKAIPAITYIGERLQWLGPNIQYGLTGSDKLRIAASASYRIGAYEESDSAFLAGLGDRNSTLLAGLGIRYEIPGGLNLLARYEHDVLNRIGGGQARVRVSKGLQAGVFRFVPQVSVNWLSADLANHDFGVPESAATLQRPAYEVGSTYSAEVGFGMFVELTEDWLLVLNLSVEQFDSAIDGSPIVDSDRVVRGFGAITYVF